MRPVGCDELKAVVAGCPVAVVAATETEAGPLREVLWVSDEVQVATKRVSVGELGGGGPRVVLGVTGCDKANAAHLLSCLLQVISPEPALVVQTGIAGAFRTRRDGLDPQIGDVVVATRETYSDTGSSSPEGWLSAAELALPVACVGGEETGGVFVLDERLAEAVEKAVGASEWPGRKPAVFRGPFVTSSRVTGLGSEAVEVQQRWEALAESMEGAAAAHICALYRVPFLQVRGVSNYVGDRDRASWRVEEAAAAAALAAAATIRELYRSWEAPRG